MSIVTALGIFIIMMVATPGPANMLLMTGGAQHGFRKCVPFLAGIIIGNTALNISIGFGLGILVTDQPAILMALKMISGSYMIWLAIKSWNSSQTTKQGTSQFTLKTGLLVHPLNPKAWVMLLLAWSDFGPQLGSLPLQMMIIVSGFLIAQLIFHTAWCWAGALLGRTIGHSPILTRSMVSLTVCIVITALIF